LEYKLFPIERVYETIYIKRTAAQIKICAAVLLLLLFYHKTCPIYFQMRHIFRMRAITSFVVSRHGGV